MSEVRDMTPLTGNWSNTTVIGSANDTSPIVASWHVLAVFSLAVFIVALLGNGLLLLVFLKERSLRTPFNIYIINLLICNLSIVVLQYPMDISNNLYSDWLMGNQACTLYMYASSVLACGMCNAHLLIAVNRMWAVSFPISYRSIHSTRVAVFLCVGMWIVIHIICGPPVVIDALYFRIPVGPSGCILNVPAQYTWEVIIDVAFCLPQFVMLAAFPVTWYAKWSQRRKKFRNVVPIAALTTQGAISGPGSENGRKISVSDGSNTAQDGQRQSQSTTAVVPSKMTTGALEKSGKASGKAKRGGGGSHSFLVLALLTISVCICWTPNNVFYSISLAYELDNFLFFQIQTILFILQTAIDPIIFTMALTNLRAGLYRLFTCRRPLR